MSGIPHLKAGVGGPGGGGSGRWSGLWGVVRRGAGSGAWGDRKDGGPLMPLREERLSPPPPQRKSSCSILHSTPAFSKKLKQQK